MKRILLIDDDMFLTSALQSRAWTAFGDAHLAVVRTISAALKYQRKIPDPDLIILDFILPDSRELDGLHRIRQSFPKSKIMMISGYSPEYIKQEALKSGADAFIAKEYINVRFLPKIIRKIMSGKDINLEHLKQCKEPEMATQYTGLSDCEKEVWHLREQGMTISAIARARNVQISTIKSQIKSIRKKLRDEVM